MKLLVDVTLTCQVDVFYLHAPDRSIAVEDTHTVVNEAPKTWPVPTLRSIQFLG